MLLVLGEDAGVEHGRVGGVGAVAAAEHAEGQLRVGKLVCCELVYKQGELV